MKRGKPETPDHPQHPPEVAEAHLPRRLPKARGQAEERNGLARLAGTWTQEEHDLFEAAVALTERIDEELWR
jgi:hypothetical protein